jgi:signal transduction histidine kinase
MAEQTSPKESSASSQPAKPSIIDDLFDLAASDNLDSMLAQALRMAIRMLRAEAGSIFFQAQPPHSLQAGAFRKDALTQIQRWENTISQRLQDSSWHIGRHSKPPVSVSTLANSQLPLASVPLLQNTKVVGLLSLVLPPGSDLPENQRDLLGKISRGVGQIAALITELTLANHSLSRIGVFYDVGQALVTTFDVTRLLLDTMELASKLVDAGAASIMLVDEEQHELVFRVSHGARAEMVRQQRIPMNEGIAGWVARNGRPVIANDARADTRFSHRVDVRTGFLTQSIAAVPLKVKGRVIGVLEVLNKYSDYGFSQDDVQLMSFIASQAAIAIENARLYNQIKHEREQIIQAQENTYRKLTANLHDGTLQYLSAINLNLDHLRILSAKASPDVLQHQIEALQKLVQKATRNTRNLLFELRPPLLESYGLLPALESYVDQLKNVSAFNLHFEAMDEIALSAKLSGLVFSVIQEAIANVIQHANANNVWITLVAEDGQLAATVKDDGQGFDTAGLGQTKKTPELGILQMREQTAAENASLEINSTTTPPNRGTTVRLTLPLPADTGSQDK